MGLFSFTKHSESIHSLKKDFRAEIEKYQEEVPISDNLEKEFQRLQKLANYVFEKGFNVHYRFTYEDLKLELKEKTIPKDLESFAETVCDTLGEMEFDMTKITKQKLIDTSNTLHSLVAELDGITEAQPKGFFGLFAKKEKLPELPMHDVLLVEKESSHLHIPKFEETKTVDGIKEPKKLEEKQLKEKPTKELIEKINEEKLDLPSFELKQKEDALKKNLVDIVKGLETGRQGVKEEINLLNKEKTILEKQKDQLMSFDLPAFKFFGQNLSNQIDGIDNKTKTLHQKGEEISERLRAISRIERGLQRFSDKLKKDDSSIKEQKEMLDKKEKLISKIKEEMNTKYKYAISEIDNLKKELAEKENNFLELQKFYQHRENKLSLEEGNLLDEKRKYGRLVSGLLGKHIEVVQQDLMKTEEKMLGVKENLKKVDSKIKDNERKFKELSIEKDNLAKEIKEKEKYFSDIEKDFLDKDPKFEEMNKLLDSKINNNIERDAAIKEFEKSLDLTVEQVRGKSDYLDVKELDIKALERETDRVNLNIRSRQTRVMMIEKHVNRRVDSYNIMKKKLSAGINNEKKVISLLESRLSKKGYIVSSKLKAIDTDEKIYDEYNRKLRDAGLPPEADVLEELSMNVDTGNPSILDILRLLNIARDYLGHNEKERARDAYLEIERIFEELNEDEREEIYPEITKVFKSKNLIYHEELPVTNAYEYNLNIDELLSRFESCVNSSDYEMSEQIYLQLQQKYSGLSKNDKNRYYPRILELYNKVLEHQVTTGIV